jgi:hypothetical protein
VIFRISMDITQILELLTITAALVPASQAGREVPTGPGLYSIFVDSPQALPEPFSEHLLQKETTLIYVGKASGNLYERLFEQDLRHKHPSTFFRGIGSILGYTPPLGSLKGKRNQYNYKFNKPDTTLIKEWIDDHLSIRWVCLDSESSERIEPELITSLRPLLNSSNNPDTLPELADLRERCRTIARS